MNNGDAKKTDHSRALDQRSGHPVDCLAEQGIPTLRCPLVFRQIDATIEDCLRSAARSSVVCKDYERTSHENLVFDVNSVADQEIGIGNASYSKLTLNLLGT